MGFSNLLNDFFSAKKLEIHTSFICEVLSFNKGAMTADLAPRVFTPSQEDRQINYPNLIGVPVSFIFGGGYYIRPEYSTGDLVLVSCTEADVKTMMTRKANATRNRFSLASAIVINGASNTLPADFSDDGLLIGSSDGQTKMKLTSGEILFTLGASTIRFSSEGVEVTGVPMTDIKVNNISLFNHTHTSTAPSNPTSPPIASP